MTHLKKISTTHPKHTDKKKAENSIKKFQEEIFKLQNVLYAQQKHSLLIILQGMDASGKDGTIKHVFSCVNPQGCNVKSFKSPTEEEKKYDYLWRIHAHIPPKGMMQIFNRSHYEDILFPTVHNLLPKKLIHKRFKEINEFEEQLKENGTVIIKFFLHISKKEQSKRLKDRLTDSHKKWKYDPGDKEEAKNWDEYMKVYEHIIDRCGHSIPWHIVPSDDKWYRNYYVAKTIADKLKSLKMTYPS